MIRFAQITVFIVCWLPVLAGVLMSIHYFLGDDPGTEHCPSDTISGFLTLIVTVPVALFAHLVTTCIDKDRQQ